MGAFTRMICSPSRSTHPLLTALHQAWSAAGEQAHNTEACGQRSVCCWHRDGTAFIGGVCEHRALVVAALAPPMSPGAHTSGCCTCGGAERSWCPTDHLSHAQRSIKLVRWCTIGMERTPVAAEARTKRSSNPVRIYSEIDGDIAIAGVIFSPPW